VYYNLKDYEKSLQYAEVGIALLDTIQNQTESAFDALRTWFDKPMAVLLQQKSVYQLQADKSVEFLKQIYQTLQKVVSIVDKRKELLTTHEDQQMLLVRYQELTAFIKKIQLELYNATGDIDYIDGLLELQEDLLYIKLRNQLNLVANVSNYNLPAEVLNREKHLKMSMQNLADNDGSISGYLDAMNQWQDFLDSIKIVFPDYFKLRYIGYGSDSLDYNPSTQTVRYAFVDSGLLAVVITKHTKKVYQLNFNPDLIKRIPEVWNDPQSIGKLTFELYQQLWEPFDSLLTDPAVMIVPDGQLFNLSFEMLTPEPITQFNDFTRNSLLAKYNLSYHYSLWLAQNYSSIDIQSSYAGFVPGFTDQMKKDYINMVADTFDIDKAYLQLLPQPFTVNLVQKISKELHGKYYFYEESTATTFKEKASGNKIIQIGTHAQSNNISPAYSRLIFAKNGNVSDEDNSVYAYEIYNTNMTSNLTLLTACETGSPAYQPGEGMISLAHAFQYAGSES
ncbi:MAG TPA: CHAT domain-containing protein, partial [Mariniphaga sp.]|nr:CHAT domain-containing protein [Mariniphaga sp.]